MVVVILNRESRNVFFLIPRHGQKTNNKKNPSMAFIVFMIVHDGWMDGEGSWSYFKKERAKNFVANSLLRCANWINRWRLYSTTLKYHCERKRREKKTFNFQHGVVLCYIFLSMILIDVNNWWWIKIGWRQLFVFLGP